MKKQAPKKAAAPKKQAAKKGDGESKMLERYMHHRGMADKHRGHADLIEAKLRAKGKEIRHQYPGEPEPKPSSSPKPVIVNRRPSMY